MISASRAGWCAATLPLPRLCAATRETMSMRSNQQVLQPVVNLVDASAQLFEIGRDIMTWFRSLPKTAIVVEFQIAKIKENVDMSVSDP